MIAHSPLKNQADAIVQLRRENSQLKKEYEVLVNCRGYDHQVMQSFQHRVIKLMREITDRNAKITQLEAEIVELRQHLNPREEM